MNTTQNNKSGSVDTMFSATVTEAQVAEHVAQAVKIMSGECGYDAMILARCTLLNNLAWDYNRAMNKKERDTTPAASVVEDELNEVFKKCGPERKEPVLDKAAILEAHAAGYVLLKKARNMPHPESGRLPMWLEEPTKSTGHPPMWPLPDSVKAALKRNVEYNIQLAKDDAERLSTKTHKVDPSARIVAIEKAADEMNAATVKEVAVAWLAACKRGILHANDEELAVAVCDCIAANGRDPLLEIRRAADAKQEQAAKRLEAGLFARLPADIWALTSAAAK